MKPGYYFAEYYDDVVLRLVHPDKTVELLCDEGNDIWERMSFETLDNLQGLRRVCGVLTKTMPMSDFQFLGPL